MRKTWMVPILASLIFAACAPDASPPENSETDRYIVVMRRAPMQKAMAQVAGLDDRRLVVQAAMASLSQRHGLLSAEKVFSVALQGGVYHLNSEQVTALSADPNIAYIEKDQMIHVEATQVSPPWGLDRLDQSNLPLDQSYTAEPGAAQVNAYVIDTGILTTHQDFQGRASHGRDLVDNDDDATDCNGHGTHVAGTIGSSTYGVAKTVKLIAVRVLNCSGSGSYSTVIAGIEWVTAHHVKPAVANMSLGGPVSQAVDDAIAASIQAGVTYAVAAGNDNTLACNGSPSRVPAAITVGSTTKTDVRSSFSNYGSCVDIYAPGSDILSTWYTSSSATNTISGTSMASPHVAGVAALYLSRHPDAAPSEVASAIVDGAANGKVGDPGNGSPNKLLNIAFLGGGGTPPVSDPVLQNGVAVEGLRDDVNGEKYFSFEVPSGTTQLKIEMDGGSGDADLYLRFGDKPSTSNYSCRPYRSGNTEDCVVAQPSPGKWFVMVRAYSAYSGVRLRATAVREESSGPCSGTGCTRFSGELKSKGAFVYEPAEFQSSAGKQEFWLSGPGQADFDIYLYKKSGSSWVQVASSTGNSSSEKIAYEGAAGTYRLKIVSYSGSGAYELFRKLP